MKKILVLMCFVFNLQAVDLSILKEYEREKGDISYAFWSFLHSCKYKLHTTKHCDKKDEIIKHFKDECENGDGRSCLDIGEVYDDELIQSDDKVKDSINYYKKSCDLGVRAACYILGVDYFVMYLNSNDEEYKKNALNLSIKYHKKSCDMGIKLSCTKLQYVEKEKKSNTKYYIAFFIAVVIIIMLYFKSEDRL